MVGRAAAQSSQSRSGHLSPVRFAADGSASPLPGLVDRRRHLLATDGWKIEGKKGIVGHGGCGKSVVRVEDRLDNEFLLDFNELRHTRQPKIRFGVNIPD